MKYITDNFNLSLLELLSVLFPESMLILMMANKEYFDEIQRTIGLFDESWGQYIAFQGKVLKFRAYIYIENIPIKII